MIVLVFDMIVLYSTRGCHRCKKVSDFFKKNDVKYEIIYIDEKDEEKEKLIMENVFSVPALRMENGKIVRMKEIVDESMNVDEKKLRMLIGD